MNDLNIDHLKVIVARVIDLGCSVISENNVLYVVTPKGWYFNGIKECVKLPLSRVTLETTVCPSPAAELAEGRY